MTTPDPDVTPHAAAVDLAVAISRISARMREEAEPGTRGLTVSQLAMLRRIIDHGPMSAAGLAAEEHVTQQAIAQRLALLKPTGLIASQPDPADKRRVLIEVTEAGRKVLEDVASSGENWLATAIGATVSPEELQRIVAATAILDRLAASKVRR